MLVALFTASNLENYINRSAEFASQLTLLWTSGSFEQKQKLQKLLFKDGIYYNKQKDETRTTNLNSLFSVIASLQRVTGDENKRPQSDFALRSLSVGSKRQITNNFIESLMIMYKYFKISNNSVLKDEILNK